MTIGNWIGQTLNNRYRIEELLGHGGMSSVYKASDPNLRRTVAIKMIHPHLSSNPDFLRRFEEEAAAVAQLRHGNIIQVFDFNHDGDTYYMVMEYIHGETLETRLKRLNAQNQRMEVREAVRIMAGICDAAAYAHSHGVIHRDIKPSNILLDGNGMPILMDFGIARIVGGQIHTAAGAIVGTALYMSPEQIKGERVDERADIYSLGITLFECVSGKPPFEADSAMTLMMKHLNDPVPDIRQLEPQVPDALVQVISKALEKKREDRYQHATEMADDLRAIYAQLSSLSTPPTKATKLPVDQTQIDIPVEKTFVDGQPVPTPAPPAAEPIQPAGHPSELSRVQQPGQEALVQPVQSAHANPEQPRRIPRTLLFVLGGLVMFAILVIGGSALVTNYLFKRASSDLPGVISGIIPTDVQPALTEVQPLIENPTSAGSALESLSTAIAPLVPTNGVDLTQSTPLPDTGLAATSTPAPAPTNGINVPANQLAVKIQSITIKNGRYVVDYETNGFTERLGSFYIHFFFNTVPPDQAGMPGKGPWVLYGGPHPFQGYTVANRPASATQICALVSNPDDSVQVNSGNCMNIPGQ